MSAEDSHSKPKLKIPELLPGPCIGQLVFTIQGIMVDVDDQGSKSDAMGVQRNWWTDEDRAAFESKTATLVAQYSAYEPIEGQFVNGANSLGENIGDVGGLAMAYHAYQLSLNDPLPLKSAVSHKLVSSTFETLKSDFQKWSFSIKEAIDQINL